MTTIETDEFALPFDQALGVWHDLEQALAGKNGYGGDVAEIYAYRLMPPSFKRSSTVQMEAQAPVVGRNLTRILRHFVELHEGVEIGIEEGRREFRAIDPHTEDHPPFSHRVHLRVSQDKRARAVFARELRALWHRANEIELPSAFCTWSGATTDLLVAIGMEWNVEEETYVFRRKS